MAKQLLPTTVVGSYPQPDWLVDRAALIGQGPVRVRAPSIWRVADDLARSGAGRCDRARHSRASSAPASTSSPTAKSAARAIPIVLPPALSGHRSDKPGDGAATFRHRPDTGAAGRRQNSAPRIRSRCAMSNSCAATRTG